MDKPHGPRLGGSSDRPKEVLELLSSIGLTRKEMGEKLGYRVATYLLSRSLVRDGFVIDLGNGKYAITDAGRKAVEDMA